MVLITGGAWQGKQKFAEAWILERGGEVRAADGSTASWDELVQAAVITNFHMWVRRLLSDGADAAAQSLELVRQNPNAVITVNELGCGIVPTDAFDRTWRESTGRICCELAKQAEAVYRVSCGIGMRIK